MADTVEVNSGTGIVVSTDDCSEDGHVQRVKLAYGADGNATQVPADGDGLLVNLGSNNDVTVTGTVDLGATDNAVLDAIAASVDSIDTAINGTLTVGSHAVTNAGTFAVQAAQSGTWNIGTVTSVTGITNALPAGTNNIGDVDVASIAAGDNVVGRVKLSDGTDVADILDLSNSNPLTVAIVDGSGDQITSFGGGTQYTEGDTDASITGTAMLMEGAGNALVAVQGTASDGLLVNLGSNNDVTVTGTVDLGATDNAVLDAIAASVAAIDTDATTIIGHVDGLEGLLTTIDADTGNIVTSVQLLDDAVAVLGTDTYTETSSKGLVIGAVRRDADTTLVNTTNEYTPLQVDANGRLKVEAFSGETLPVSLTSTTVTGTVAVTQSGTWDEVGINDSGNSITVDAPVGTPVFVRLSDGSSAITTLPVSLASVPSHAVTNAGTFVTQENGSALTALQLLDDCIVADDATFTPASTKVSMCGFTADEGSTDSIDEGDGGAARMTLDRKQIVTNYVHASAGGATAYKNLDVDESEDDVKTAAGRVYWLHAVNLSSGVRYLKFYNATAANVTVGTTTPVLTFPIPTFADTNGAGFTIHFGDVGIQFDTAICIAATTGLADNNTGAPGANEVVVNLGYS